jgi:hypothetical protein
VASVAGVRQWVMPDGTLILADDALLGMLLPFWQLVIGLCVLLAVGAACYRLAARGPSRMTTALLVTGTAVVGIVFLSYLAGSY